jgi:hypothetical protein
MLKRKFDFYALLRFLQIAISLIYFCTGVLVLSPARKETAHRTLATQQTKLAYLGFQCLDHPPYSPDLAPSDYHLFPGLKKQLKGK